MGICLKSEMRSYEHQSRVRWRHLNKRQNQQLQLKVANQDSWHLRLPMDQIRVANRSASRGSLCLCQISGIWKLKIQWALQVHNARDSTQSKLAKKMLRKLSIAPLDTPKVSKDQWFTHHSIVDHLLSVFCLFCRICKVFDSWDGPDFSRYADRQGCKRESPLRAARIYLVEYHKTYWTRKPGW